MPDIRSAAKLNGLPMTGLLGSGASFNVFRSVCSTSVNPTTTEADITGTSMSVVVPTASSIVLCIAHFDMDCGTVTGSLNGYVNWNSSDSSACSFTNGRSSLHYRATMGFTYSPTISSAGTFTAKLRASSTTATTDFAIRSAHTTLTILVVSG